jgi:hypothetical protein
MQKSYWQHLVECGLPSLVAVGLMMADGASAEINRRVDYCAGGIQVRRLSVFFSRKIAPTPAGLPLDAALEREKLLVAELRESARSYYRKEPPEALAQMMHEYTFLMPPSAREKLGLSDLAGVSEITVAVKYRSYLWRLYLERFTHVEEAPGIDPYTLRFKVELDLDLFCRYRKKLEDLVVRGGTVQNFR